jgi:Chaperone of endosialidase
MAFNWPANDLTVQEKVGVGTDAPAEKLEVKGNIKLNTGVAIGEFSNDGMFLAASDQASPTTLAVKIYVGAQVATVNTALIDKANKSGSLTQNFQTNNLTVQGNLEVTGQTTFRNIEQHQGDLELGNEDTDQVRIHGVVRSTHSSSTLQVASPLNVTGKLTVTGNANIGNTFLGDVGHGNTWAGFSHGSSVSKTSYALLQQNDGIYTLLNKKSGGGYLGFRVDNVDKMVINDSGNVGIGLTNPDARLHILANTQNTGNNTACLQAPSIGPNTSHIHWGTTGDWYIRSASPSGNVYLQDTGGSVHIPAARLSFGSSVRQMINLWTEEYGIGVQSGTTYFRSWDNFCWFRGGVHNNNRDNPGGGVRLMAVNGAGDLILSARTNPSGNPAASPCRALVDNGGKLIINIANDYPQGVDIVNGRFVSSRELKQNIATLSTEEATIALHDLKPVTFSYKTDTQDNQHVGFIAEEVPDLLAAPDRRSIGPLDVVAVLTKVLQEQQQAIATLTQQVQSLEANLTAIAGNSSGVT